MKIIAIHSYGQFCLIDRYVKKALENIGIFHEAIWILATCGWDWSAILIDLCICGVLMINIIYFKETFNKGYKCWMMLAESIHPSISIIIIIIESNLYFFQITK